MANYHLMTNKNKEIEFTKIPYFNSLNSKSLANIVDFTSYFRDETHLKQTLLKYNLIKEDEYKDKLCITYQYNKKTKKLMYGLTYEDDKKYFDIEYIKCYLKGKMNNIEFLEKMCNHYRNSYNQGININIIMQYINYVRNNEILEENQLINECLYALSDFVNKEVYLYDRKTNSYKIKYKNLRDLAMFLAYDNKKNILKLSIDLEERKEKEEFFMEDNKEVEIKNEDKPKQKKKRKKNNTVDGQLTFEDMGWI